METWARESRLRLAVMCCLTIWDYDDEDDNDEDNNDEDDVGEDGADGGEDDDDEPGGQASSEGGNVGEGSQVKAGLPMDRFFISICVQLMMMTSGKNLSMMEGLHLKH